MPPQDTTAREGHGAWQLLRHHAPFRSLFTARVVSFTGDSLSLVALMLHVADTTGQAIAVSLLLLAGDLMPGVISPLAGAVCDRFDRKRVMIICELAQAALMVGIALSLPPLPLLLSLVALRAMTGHVFLPASRAAVATLVTGRDLPAANSTIGLGTNAGEVLGPLLAAALLPFLGVRGVLLADAATFVLAALLLITVPRIPPARDDDPPASLFSDTRAGLAFIWKTRPVRIIVLGFCVVVAFNGIDDVALVLLATDTFDAGESGVGLLLAAVAIGLFAGYAVLARFSARMSMAALLIIGFGVSSLGNLLTGVVWAVSAAFVVQTVRGAGIAAMDVATNTLLPRLMPAGMLGRVFANLYGAVGIAAGLSYVGGGLLLDATSAPATFVVAGIGGTLTSVVVALALRRSPLWRNLPGEPRSMS
ncbi:MFS transporter [Phytoactinopolyspora alkaliphila]|uniref:MFS transporter n=1 Tax=Phytoactinopolyspora alkaliphila TaxID=1783498 RepID=A0A6N9YG65_9ACTN|nr:MFS transporter [Phytoactinopolyspora alkaliphila]NED93952.1 MFS transporter [Phytoactinopolyspora alkaliphila]